MKDHNIVSPLSTGKLLKIKKKHENKNNAVRLSVRCTCIQDSIVSRKRRKRIKRKKIKASYFGFTYHIDANINTSKAEEKNN